MVMLGKGYIQVFWCQDIGSCVLQCWGVHMEFEVLEKGKLSIFPPCKQQIGH